MYKKGRSPFREKKEFEEEVIQIDRVTRVVKGGRRLRFRATVAIGNRKGKVGVGVGKSTEVTGAIQKAIAQAKKTIVVVPMVEKTIPHRIKFKFKSAKLLMMPACPGTGIIAGGPLRKILELAGIKDILAKCLGNNNRLINSQATVLALASLKEIPWLVKKEEEKKKAEEQVNKEKKQNKPQVKTGEKQQPNTKGDKQETSKEKPANPKTEKVAEPPKKEEKKESKETDKPEEKKS